MSEEKTIPPAENTAEIAPAAEPSPVSPPWTARPGNSAVPIPPVLERGPWFERKLGLWRIQRVLCSAGMVASAATLTCAPTQTRVGLNFDGLLLLASLTFGFLAFSATRKLHVVAQFESDGLIRLNTKASLRSLAWVAIYSLVLGAIATWAGTEFMFGFGTALGVTLFSYILTVFSTYRAVHACRDESRDEIQTELARRRWTTGG